MPVVEAEGAVLEETWASSETEPAAATEHRPERRVLIHVGLHRTGTTYLQKRVFPRLGGVEYAEKPSSAQLERLAAERDDRRTLLISHEGMLARKRDGRARPERLARLAELFPGAEPMLTVRRHDRWVRSLYVYKGHRHSFETFLNEREPPTLMPHVRLLERAFDRPPRVLFQEELEEASEAAAELLAQWAGALLRSAGTRRRRVNRGLSEGGAPVGAVDEPPLPEGGEGAASLSLGTEADTAPRGRDPEPSGWMDRESRRKLAGDR